MSRKTGWHRMEPYTVGRWALVGTGWQVRHGGDPRASRPYYGESREGETCLAPDGRPFRTLAQAMRSVEARAAGGPSHVDIQAAV